MTNVLCHRTFEQNCIKIDPSFRSLSRSHVLSHTNSFFFIPKNKCFFKFNCISSLSSFLESPPQSQFLGAGGIKNKISNKLNKVKYKKLRIMVTILHCQNPSACSTNLNPSYLFLHYLLILSSSRLCSTTDKLHGSCIPGVKLCAFPRWREIFSKIRITDFVL